MLNSQFNEIFNQDNQIAVNIKWLIEFDWFDLTSMCWGKKTWYMLKNWDVLDLNNINIWEFVSSTIDWGWVYNKKYWNRQVTFRLFIQGENHQDLMDKIDSLKELTQWVEKNFDVLFFWWYRTTKATLTGIKIPSFWKNQDFVDDVEISFLFTSWYWENITPKSELFPNITGNYEVIITNEWKYKTFPIFYINTKSSWNAITKIEIEIKKVWETSGYSVYIEESIWNNALVVFDYSSKTVKIWLTEVPFFWPMTPFDIWENVVNFYFTWSTSVDINTSYNKTYL